MRIKISNFFYLILGLIGFKTAVAADNVFLCALPELEGESKHERYLGCIDVLAWSWGANVAVSSPSGGGRVAGAPNFQELAITKSVDKASPVLMSHTAGGKVFPKVEMFVDNCSLECANSAYYKLKMENVLVSSVNIGGATGGERATEHISLNYEKIVWCYTPQDAKGGLGVEICHGWDLAANKPN